MKKKLIVTVITLAITLAAYATFSFFPFSKAPKKSPTIIAQKDDFLVSVICKGNVVSARQISIKNRIKGKSTVIFLAEEGAYVKKGDLLLELADAELQAQLEEETVDLVETQNKLKRFKQSIITKKVDFENETAALNLKLVSKTLELEKYTKASFPSSKRSQENKISIAEADMLKAKRKFERSRFLYEKEYINRSELDANEFTLKQKENSLSQFKDKLKLMLNFEYPQKVTVLKNDIKKLNNKLAINEHVYKSDLAILKTQVERTQTRVNIRQGRVQRIQSYIKACKISKFVTF